MTQETFFEQSNKSSIVFACPVFPAILHALTQVLIGHTANHVGQLSTWRHAMNLPPMRRGFE